MDSGTGGHPLEPSRSGPWSNSPNAVAEDQRVAPPSEDHSGSVAREPVFRAPLALILLIAALLAAFALQSITGVDAGAARFGFAPADLGRGAWDRLITAQFVHGGWGHVLMNTLGALAFGAPVARLFGSGLRGVAAFFAFYLCCGALACLGYALVHSGSETLVVGASGGISALMGAASRLIGLRLDGAGERLLPFRSSTVLGMAAAWLAVNALIGWLGVSPGVGAAPVAWEAHLFGYGAGLLLIWPTARALGRLRPDLVSPGIHD